MKNTKRWMGALLAIVCVLSLCLLSGCSQKADENQGAAGGSDSQTLIVYTARSESLNNAVIENFEADTGIHVEVVTGGTGEVLKRVKSEASNPQGDICWAADEAMLKDYAECFEPYVSPEDVHMMEGYKNVTGYSSPAFCDPTVFIVNTDLAGDLQINGFADLLNPALKGKIAAGDPVNSSSAFQCLIAGLYDMGSGDPMSDAAWAWASDLVANLDGVSLNSSSQVYKGVAEGEYVVGLTWEDPAAAYVRDGVAVKVVFPEEGALMSGQCVSVIKGAPHMENAKKFDLIRRCMGCRQQERRNRKIYRVPGKRRLIQNKCRPLASGRGLHFYLEKQRRKVLQRIWVLPSPLKTP